MAVKGLEDLKFAIEDLRQDLRKKVVRGALRDAAQPVVKAARARAPVLKNPVPYRTTGLLKRSIKAFNSKTKNGRNGVIGVYIRVARLKAKQIRAFKATGLKSTQNAKDPYYWWWVEFGTKKMPPRPFIRPAIEASETEALARFSRRIKERIDKANRRKP